MSVRKSGLQALRPVDFNFTKDDFSFIADIAMARFGLNLPSTKHQMVYSRISKRMRSLGISDFTAYKDLICQDEISGEHLEFLSALTTNVTQFFREAHHFEFLKSKILPNLINKARRGARVRIWSAGCSTGQEPYSIALSVLELCSEAADLDIKILATDIDPKVVKKAAVGHYSTQEVEQLPESYIDNYFSTNGTDKGYLSIKSSIKPLLSFGVLNLVKPLPVSGPFDIVFCRNVAIYFDKGTQAKVWNQITSVLIERGHLFIGHSETLSGSAISDLRAVDVTTYQKIEN